MATGREKYLGCVIAVETGSVAHLVRVSLRGVVVVVITSAFPPSRAAAKRRRLISVTATVALHIAALPRLSTRPQASPKNIHMYRPVDALATIQLHQVNRLIVGQPCTSRRQVRSCGKYNAMRTALNTTKHNATTAPAAISNSGSPASAQAAILFSASSIGVSLTFA